MRFHKISFIFVLLLAITGFFFWQQKAKTQFFPNQIETVDNQADQPASDYTKKIEITDGATYGALMAQAGINPKTSAEILTAAKDIYDLSRIRAGRTLDLVYEPTTNELKKIIYQINNETELVVTNQESGWLAEQVNIDYQIIIATAEGVIRTSMYQAGIEADTDERAIIEFANAMQWNIDFAMDVRENDSFLFIYQKLYRDGEYIMPGKVLAGKYNNIGKLYYIFYFKESEDNEGYFDEQGNSVQKLFLKAPLEYKYISSGFTTGLRYVQAFNVSTGHRAIDYAAAAGTPIRSVGDGTISFAGWNGSYGNFVTVRHNGTYSTNYAHMSRIAVKKGQRVSQGQVIGYVGSTGFSTGPHLHYEMVKNGVKINPLTETLPPGEKIKEENLETYFDYIQKYSGQLGL